MTEEWQDGVHRGGRAPRAREGLHQGRDPRLGEEDLLRRRGAEGRAQVRPERRAAGVPLDRGREEADARARDARHAGGRGARGHGAGRRLGDRALRALPHRAGRSVDPARPARGRRSACCPARAASPRPCACSACRRRFPTWSKARRCGRRKRRSSAWCRGWPRTRRTCSAWRANGSPPIPSPKQPWDDQKYRMPGGGPSQSGDLADAVDRAGDAGGEDARPLPGAQGDHVGDGGRRATSISTPRCASSRATSRRLAVGPVAKNLISLFFNRTAIKSGASRPKDVPKWKATKVGILGAGMMGGGIAYANAVRGVPAC